MEFSVEKKRPFLLLTSPTCLPVVTSLFPNKCLISESPPNTYIMTTYTLLIICVFPETFISGVQSSHIYYGGWGGGEKSDLVQSSSPTAEDVSRGHHGFHPVSLSTTLAVHQGTKSRVNSQFLSVPHTPEPQRHQVRT